MKSQPTIYTHNNLPQHLKQLQKFEQYMSNKLNIPQSEIPAFNERQLLHTHTEHPLSKLNLNGISKKSKEETQ